MVQYENIIIITVGNKRNNIMNLIYNAEWTKELAGDMTDDSMAVQ